MLRHFSRFNPGSFIYLVLIETTVVDDRNDLSWLFNQEATATVGPGTPIGGALTYSLQS